MYLKIKCEYIKNYCAHHIDVVRAKTEARYQANVILGRTGQSEGRLKARSWIERIPIRILNDHMRGAGRKHARFKDKAVNAKGGKIGQQGHFF
tara:strand:- start:37531 stop:37809 length:279 start_codon:yes stop_codon:yes gene_type:complete